MFGPVNALKLLFASLLVASPVGFLVGGETETAPAGAREAGPSAPEDFGAPVLQEFRKDFDGRIATGELDLRIDWGDVRVFGWNENAYLVQVLQQTAGGQAASDFETLIDFKDTSSGDVMKLSLLVDQEGTYGVGVQGSDPTPATAIVAYVPKHAFYTKVFACAGQGHMFDDTFDGIDPWPFDEEPAFTVEQECVADDATPGFSIGSIGVNSDRSPAPRVTTGVEEISGKDLLVYSRYGDVDASNASFEAISLLANHGDLSGTNLEGTGATLMTEYGDIVVLGGSVTTKAWSRYGDVDVELTPKATGAHDLLTEYGDISLMVPQGPAFGYQVASGTNYGDIVIALVGAKVKETEAEDEEFDPAGWLQPGTGYRHTATGGTSDFAGRAVQVDVKAFTDYGDILVTDGSRPAKKEKDDHDGAREPAAAEAARLLNGL
ncbi:MAG: DUF4097 family beta strand repeat-containing protein [Methanobacteriota archaeon]